MIPLLQNPRWARFRARFWHVLIFVPGLALVGLVGSVSDYRFVPMVGVFWLWLVAAWFLFVKAGIRCDHCKQYIASDTPWICGFCNRRNENVVDFPFIQRCEYCRAEPKAYECHHCKGLIFLGQDRLASGFARCASTPVQTNTQKPPLLQEEAQRLQQELHNARLQADLARQKQELEELQKPSSRRKRELDVLLGEAEDKLGAMAKLFGLREKWRKETTENPNLSEQQKKEQFAEIDRTVEEIRMQLN